MAEAQEQHVVATCAICIEPFNLTIRKKVTCGNCNMDICKKCIKRYLAENLQQPNCMQCRWIYTKQFMDSNFSVKFRKTALQQIREVVLVEREKQHLPELMHRASAKKSLIAIEKELADANRLFYSSSQRVMKSKSQLTELSLEPSLNLDAIAEIKKLYDMDKETMKQAQDTQERLLKTRNEYRRVYWHGGQLSVSAVVKCIDPECKGYLDNNYICGLCNMHVCKECHVQLEEGHVCNPDNIASVKAIAEETRPCPTCQTRIFKIIGCDQMFCTQCHTAFSWNTGMIETGRLHNPHYYEWVRARNRGNAPREMGDVPCGGLPRWNIVEAKMAELGVSIANTIYLREILKMALQLQEKEVRKFPVIQGRNSEMDLVSVDYLAGDISERIWKNKLVTFEIQKEMNTEQRLLLDMMLAVLIDYLNSVQTISKDEVDTMLWELEELRKYYNSCITNMNERFDCRKFRQITYDWAKLIA
jgi:hypothetical protein